MRNARSDARMNARIWTGRTRRRASRALRQGKRVCYHACAQAVCREGHHPRRWSPA